MKTVLSVSGMHCPRCTAKVQEALERLQGVQSAAASLTENTASIEHGTDVSVETLSAAITAAGFGVSI
jgi:copper chaperone CopZ